VIRRGSRFPSARLGRRNHRPVPAVVVVREPEAVEHGDPGDPSSDWLDRERQAEAAKPKVRTWWLPDA
jgi:hypothetical protein